MGNDTRKAYEIMNAGHYTCVIYNSDKNKLYTSKKSGVKPLIELVDNKADAKGFFAADRVVGKAAAFLYVLLSVKSVYANVMSEPAKLILKQNDILCYANETVSLIRNRANTGYCPMESAVLNITDPKEAYRAIKKKLKELEV